jgi:hypothetical protein
VIHRSPMAIVQSTAKPPTAVATRAAEIDDDDIGRERLSPL